jgi:Adenylate and Guanylate cyclase catalytic domain
VGDCYVAVTGLPEPRRDHAVAMARFARDCMQQTKVLTKKLEVTLGPETAELAMRMGIHSGPVTAGVLRGARSRFQLFGDTMNTAARMESTGIRNKIQISQEFADLLIVAGKSNWISRREDGEFLLSSFQRRVPPLISHYYALWTLQLYMPKEKANYRLTGWMLAQTRARRRAETRLQMREPKLLPSRCLTTNCPVCFLVRTVQRHCV